MSLSNAEASARPMLARPVAAGSMHPCAPVVSVFGDAEREVPACVAGADLVPLVAALELLERVFAGGLQQEESSALDVAHEALVDE